MTAPCITVLVVDDHTLFRRGIKSLLDAHARLQVVGEAADGAEALRLAAALRPQVILLDQHLPGAKQSCGVPGAGCPHRVRRRPEIRARIEDLGAGETHAPYVGTANDENPSIGEEDRGMVPARSGERA